MLFSILSNNCFFQKSNNCFFEISKKYLESSEVILLFQQNFWLQKMLVCICKCEFIAICNENIFAIYRKIHFRHLWKILICSKYDKLKNIGLVFFWINLPDVSAFDIGKIQRFQWLLVWILERISGNPGTLGPGAFHCCCCYY